MLLAVLPHLVQLLPSILESLEPLSQEHVLSVVLGCDVLSRDTLSVLHHLGVVLCVVVDLLPDALVLVQQLLSLWKVGRDIFGSHIGHGLGQPRLEVVEIPEEAVKVSSLFQLGISFLEELCELIPHFSDLLNSLPNKLGFLGMIAADLISLSLQSIQLRLDSSQISLHTRQASLEGHDSAEISTKVRSLQQHPLLVLDPENSLPALDMEGLDPVSGVV